MSTKYQSEPETRYSRLLEELHARGVTSASTMWSLVMEEVQQDLKTNEEARDALMRLRDMLRVYLTRFPTE